MNFQKILRTILRWSSADMTHISDGEKNIQVFLKFSRSCDGEIAYSDIACPDSDIFQYSSFSSYSNMFLGDG